MRTETIQVYFNGGDAGRPWHVALHDGVSVVEIYRQFRNPVDAVRYALDSVATVLDLPVLWPQWLKVVVA